MYFLFRYGVYPSEGSQHHEIIPLGLVNAGEEKLSGKNHCVHDHNSDAHQCPTEDVELDVNALEHLGAHPQSSTELMGVLATN